MTRLEKKPIEQDKMSIGNKAKGSNEKEKPSDKREPTSKLVTIETMSSSKEAITKETKQLIIELKCKNFLLSFFETPRHLDKAISFLPSKI